MGLAVHAELGASSQEIIDDLEARRRYFFLTAPGGLAPYRLRVLAVQSDGSTTTVFDSSGDDGVPDGRAQPCWLLQVVEPQPPSAAEPAPPAEPLVA